MAVSGEPEGVVQAVLDVGERLLGSGQAALGGLHLGGGAVLFPLEEVKRDGSGVMSLEELGPVVGELGQPCLLLAASSSASARRALSRLARYVRRVSTRSALRRMPA